MSPRLIGKVEIKSQNVVKPIYFEGLKKVGNPEQTLNSWSMSGIDEIIYIDIVASLYGRYFNFKQLNDSAKNIFIPITAGGGIQSIKEAENFFANGADKVCINSFALKNKDIIFELAKNYGSQAIVLNIEAKKKSNTSWECFYENGRSNSSLNVKDWILEAKDLGVGEIFIQSIDQDGSKNGYDLDLYKETCNLTNLPIVLGSGYGKISHMEEIFKIKMPSGFCISTIFHENHENIENIKNYLNKL